MDAFLLLVVCVVFLMVLGSRLYKGNAGGGPAATDESERRTDRLATLLDPDVMEALTAKSARDGRSEIRLANDLLRAALRDRSP